MLHGTREVFDYVECGSCGCVQIAAIPADLSRFYPQDYFSFRSHRSLDRNLARRLIDPCRVRASFGTPDWIGSLAEKVSRPFDYVDWVRRAGLGPDARVLDVGCGAGKTLLNMALGGFPEPQGVDPFIDDSLRYRCGVTVHKLSLEDYARTGPTPFSLIMFHHSLEHMLDPRAALAVGRSLLSSRGRILVAVPVADSWAWRAFRGDWCNLDAPRHIHLLTTKAMEILAANAGLVVVGARSVGRLSQFTGSERYRRDIPANPRRNDRDLFTRGELAEWRRRTEELNDEGQGDQTMFFLAAA
jgi:SAM-dependent methyltransferase